MVGTKDMVTLISKDGVKIELPADAARGSVVISNAAHLEDGNEEGEGYKDVELDRVTSKVLEKVAEFLIQNTKDPMAAIPDPSKDHISNNLEEIVPVEWYRNYVGNMDLSLLYAVRSAANYLEIEQLYRLTSLWLVFQMIGMNAEEIRKLLRLPKMTDAEEEKARKDYPWLFELNLDDD